MSNDDLCKVDTTVDDIHLNEEMAEFCSDQLLVLDANKDIFSPNEDRLFQFPKQKFSPRNRVAILLILKSSKSNDQYINEW